MDNRRAAVFAAALALVISGAGCGADPGSPARAEGEAAAAAPDAAGPFTGDLPIAAAIDLRGQAEVTVVVHDNSYSVENATDGSESRVIRIDPGANVTWKNDGANPHNVIPSVDKAFKEIATGSLDPGKAASVRFEHAGVYPYHCSIHGTKNKGQRGLIVVGGDAPAGAPAP